MKNTDHRENRKESDHRKSRKKENIGNLEKKGDIGKMWDIGTNVEYKENRYFEENG